MIVMDNFLVLFLANGQNCCYHSRSKYWTSRCHDDSLLKDSDNSDSDNSDSDNSDSDNDKKSDGEWQKLWKWQWENEMNKFLYPEVSRQVDY